MTLPYMANRMDTLSHINCSMYRHIQLVGPVDTNDSQLHQCAFMVGGGTEL